MSNYRIGVDIGGTFTDCVVVDDDGRRTVSKHLTTHGVLGDGVVGAITESARLLELDLETLLAHTQRFVHGNTVATNALLTRRGAKTGLLTTRGHEDTLIVGRVLSKRAGLPERAITHSSRQAKPEPVVPRSLTRGIAERMDSHGEIVAPLDESSARIAIRELVQADVEAIAISLLWSFANNKHEQRLAEFVAEEAPGAFISISSEVAPVLGEYERTATTALNAYVGPRVVEYLGELESRLNGLGLRQPILVMQASGGLSLIPQISSRPLVTLDSGPTGGILGCQRIGEIYSEPNVICTDVGGTSFDVGLVLDGEVPLDPDPVVSQYSLRFPKVSVRSIGAGGGSIAWLDEGDVLRVGPQSAGSQPGPACYERGGTAPTVTDADLVLGYLNPENFLGGRMALSHSAAIEALQSVGHKIGLEPEEVAIGVFKIVNAQMADLIRRSTIEQGVDPRTCVLIAYGGAGATHAAYYGRDIGAKTIMILPDSTAFSAEGMLTCSITQTIQSSNLVRSPFSSDEVSRLVERFDDLEGRIRNEFGKLALPADEVQVTRSITMRFLQQVHSLDVNVPDGRLTPESAMALIGDYRARYAEIYGGGAALSLESVVETEMQQVVGTVPIEPLTYPRHELGAADPTRAQKGTRRAWFEQTGFSEAPVYDGEALSAGQSIVGGAIIERMGDSVVVPTDFTATVDEFLTLHLRETEPR